ncbi:MAG: hypothetical protein WD055_02420 [Candidatus Dependentiae bacterium]
MFVLYFFLLFLPALSFGDNTSSSPEKNISQSNLKDPAGEFLSEQRFNAERRKTSNVINPHNCFEKTASLHMLARLERRQPTLVK